MFLEAIETAVGTSGVGQLQLAAWKLNRAGTLAAQASAGHPLFLSLGRSFSHDYRNPGKMLGVILDRELGY